jgi:hypothetical protein
MKPLFERYGMYAKFLDANKWVEKILPNSLQTPPPLIGKTWRRAYYSLRTASFFLHAFPLEILVRKLQKISIKKHQTKEIVLNSFLAFHPIDYRAQTLQVLRKKSQLLGLLTKE